MKELEFHITTLMYERRGHKEQGSSNTQVLVSSWILFHVVVSYHELHILCPLYSLKKHLRELARGVGKVIQLV
jgi:hypothetical protein